MYYTINLEKNQCVLRVTAQLIAKKYNTPFQPHLKPFFNPLMAVWRVLVLNKWRRFAPPDKHTPHELNSLNYTRKIKARTEGEAAAKPLADLRL